MSSGTATPFDDLPPAEEVEDLDSAFSLLVRMTRDVAMSADILSTLADAVSLMAEYLGAESGSLWLLDEGATEFECKTAVGSDGLVGMKLPSSSGIIGRSVRDRAAQRVADVSRDPDFAASVDERAGTRTRSLICAPLLFGEDALGAVVLTDKDPERGPCFCQRDIDLLTALTGSAALALANARFARQGLEHDRVRTELETAAAIQRNLLPSRRPQPFPIVGSNLAARTVSGDLYDILPLADGRISFCLGDVSGKSMNASLLMAKTASLYRCLAKRAESPSQLLHALNVELCETTTRGMFVTLVTGLYDPVSGQVTLANAGHEPVLIEDVAGNLSYLEAESPPLGILEEIDFPETAISVRDGRVYVYSDGLTEAKYADGRPVGADGLAEIIRARPCESPDRRVDGVLGELKKLDHRDDLTLLILDDASRESDRPCSEFSKLLKHRIPARAEALSELRGVVRDALESAGCSPQTNSDIVLAIDEACQNVIRHAYHGECDQPIEIEIERDGSILVFRLYDEADPIDADEIRPRELAAIRPGGLGIHFIKNVMDEMDFLPSPRGEGNLLKMSRRLD